MKHTFWSSLALSGFALLSGQDLNTWTAPFNVTQPIGENVNPRSVAGANDTSGLILWERIQNDSTTDIILISLVAGCQWAGSYGVVHTGREVSKYECLGSLG